MEVEMKEDREEEEEAAAALYKALSVSIHKT